MVFSSQNGNFFTTLDTEVVRANTAGALAGGVGWANKLPLLDLQDSMMLRLLMASMLSFFKTRGFSVWMTSEAASDFLCRNMADGFRSNSFDKGGGDELP